MVHIVISSVSFRVEGRHEVRVDTLDIHIHIHILPRVPIHDPKAPTAPEIHKP
jgi:hypothetical protein